MRAVTVLALALFAGCAGSKPDNTGAGADTDAVGSVDADRDGYSADEDCDDTDASKRPDGDEICDGLDNDCDGLIDDDDDSVAGDPVYNDGDGDGYGDDASATVCGEVNTPVAYGGDCDDANPAYNPGATEGDCADPNDYNCDGSTGDDDADGDGSIACEDCDDGNASTYPGGTEVCDGADNDCDGAIDAADSSVTDATTVYDDLDADGYGDDATANTDCAGQGQGVLVGGDCDDSDSDYHPGAAEADCADPNDYNCDGSTAYEDADGDGYAACEECDDANASAYPGGTEVCDGADNDCDADIDDDDTDIVGQSTWYADDDGDSFGDALSTTESCAAPTGYTSDSDDCDDGDTAINPDAKEACDGEDNDCDGLIDDEDTDVSGGSTWYNDADEDGYGDSAKTKKACDAPDGYVSDASDCNDKDEDIHPGADEICNTDDDDCDGFVDDADSSLTDGSTVYADADADGYGDDSSTKIACKTSSGYSATSGDCDDGDATINPGEADDCDGSDNDCSDVVDDGGDCPCEQDWYGDHSYLFCETDYTWSQAESGCGGYNYDLATIDDSTENDFVYKDTYSIDRYDYWWIGYNDRTTEGTFVWESGSSSTYTNWTSGQPNGGGSDDCVFMYPYNGNGWYDYSCSSGSGYSSYVNFVCESR